MSANQVFVSIMPLCSNKINTASSLLSGPQILSRHNPELRTRPHPRPTYPTTRAKPHATHRARATYLSYRISGCSYEIQKIACSSLTFNLFHEVSAYVVH